MDEVKITIKGGENVDAHEFIYDLEALFEQNVKDKVYEVAYDDGVKEGRNQIISEIRNSNLANKDEILNLVSEN